jgi:hypothetical protein
MPSTLAEELASQKKHRCYDDSSASFIEFRPTPRTRHGFALAQLLHYTLEPDLGELTDAPRERLVLAFSTADVVVFGVRLTGLTDLLRDHKLAAVWPLAERYNNLFPDKPVVAEIVVRLLDKSGGAAG